MVRRSLNVSFAAHPVMMLPIGLAFAQGGGATGVGNPGSGTAPSSSPPITGQSSAACSPSNGSGCGRTTGQFVNRPGQIIRRRHFDDNRPSPPV